MLDKAAILELAALMTVWASLALPYPPAALSADKDLEPAGGSPASSAAAAVDAPASTSSAVTPADKAAPADKISTGEGDKRPYAEEAVRHYNRGVELHQAGFLNQAIAEYKAAIDADSRMEEAYSNLGLIYAAQRNYTRAIEAFNKALSLKPARPTTLNGLGTVLYAKGKVEEAMEKWKQAIAADPQFASAYYNMGNALENEKESQGALKAYVKAIKINPGMADAYYRIGTIFNKDKHAAQASLLLSTAVKLSPEADFVRDAKRQLSALESQFAKEANEEPEIEMNVMPPPREGSAPSQGQQPASPRPATNSAGLNMFVQPR